MLSSTLPTFSLSSSRSIACPTWNVEPTGFDHHSSSPKQSEWLYTTKTLSFRPLLFPISPICLPFISETRSQNQPEFNLFYLERRVWEASQIQHATKTLDQRSPFLFHKEISKNNFFLSIGEGDFSKLIAAEVRELNKVIQFLLWDSRVPRCSLGVGLYSFLRTESVCYSPSHPLWFLWVKVTWINSRHRKTRRSRWSVWFCPVCTGPGWCAESPQLCPVRAWQRPDQTCNKGQEVKFKCCWNVGQSVSGWRLSSYILQLPHIHGQKLGQKGRIGSPNGVRLAQEGHEKSELKEIDCVKRKRGQRLKIGSKTWPKGQKLCHVPAVRAVAGNQIIRTNLLLVPPVDNLLPDPSVLHLTGAPCKCNKVTKLGHKKVTDWGVENSRNKSQWIIFFQIPLCFSLEKSTQPSAHRSGN